MKINFKSYDFIVLFSILFLYLRFPLFAKADSYTEVHVTKLDISCTFINYWQFDVDENENTYFLEDNPPRIVSYDKTGMLIFNTIVQFNVIDFHHWFLFAGKNKVILIPIMGSEFYIFDVQSKEFSHIVKYTREAPSLKYINGQLLSSKNQLLWSSDGSTSLNESLSYPLALLNCLTDTGLFVYVKKNTNLKIPMSIGDLNFHSLKTSDFENNIFAIYDTVKPGKTDPEDDDSRLVRLNASTLTPDHIWNNLWKVKETSSCVYSIENEKDGCWLTKWCPSE